VKPHGHRDARNHQQHLPKTAAKTETASQQQAAFNRSCTKSVCLAGEVAFTGRDQELANAQEIIAKDCLNYFYSAPLQSNH
jgi:hypothetical protein